MKKTKELSDGVVSFMLGLIAGSIAVGISGLHHWLTGDPPRNYDGLFYYCFMLIGMTLFMWAFFYYFIEGNRTHKAKYDQMMRIGKMNVEAEKERKEKEARDQEKVVYGTRSVMRKHLGLR